MARPAARPSGRQPVAVLRPRVGRKPQRRRTTGPRLPRCPRTAGDHRLRCVARPDRDRAPRRSPRGHHRLHQGIAGPAGDAAARTRGRRNPADRHLGRHRTGSGPPHRDGRTGPGARVRRAGRRGYQRARHPGRAPIPPGPQAESPAGRHHPGRFGAGDRRSGRPCRSRHRPLRRLDRHPGRRRAA